MTTFSTNAKARLPKIHLDKSLVGRLEALASSMMRRSPEVGERLMDEQAKAHDFVVEQPVILRLDRTRGVYISFVRSSRDIQDKRGRTRVFFDANDGRLKPVQLEARGSFDAGKRLDSLASSEIFCSRASIADDD